ncbi:hypothetical protein ACVS9P_09135 [Caproicibacterium sp. NSD3]
MICTAVITVVAVAFSKYPSNGYWGWNNDKNTYYQYQPLDGKKAIIFTESSAQSLSFSAEMSFGGKAKISIENSQGETLSSVDLKEGKSSYQLNLPNLQGMNASLIADGEAEKLNIWLDASKIKVAANSAQESEKTESAEPAKSKEDGGGVHIWPFF